MFLVDGGKDYETLVLYSQIVPSEWIQVDIRGGGLEAHRFSTLLRAKDFGLEHGHRQQVFESSVATCVDGHHVVGEDLSARLVFPLVDAGARFPSFAVIGVRSRRSLCR